ncbi:MAG: amidohydrolase family protein [Acidimicrobiales bacterium]|nr:amidohydrolase family protein [Acidimicrobiales bacterium]
MFDVVIRGGVLVDGTGAERRPADVAIEGGRIAAVVEPGGLDDAVAAGDAARVIEAEGLVVAPGFVDLHTHYDAQAFWDPTLSPSPLHGVTTVVAGNCGFSIAPLSGDPADGEYLMRMLARVEGMPLESLAEGVPWDWRSTAEYLDRLDGTLAVNAGFLVGHSALRRAVMGHDAVGEEATDEQVDAMAALLAEGLAAGGLGFSSSWATTHSDGEGDPVPSRHATHDELVRLCSVLRDHPGTALEFIPTVGPFADEHMDLMADMSLAADRPLNWNVLVAANARSADDVAQRLSASDRAAERGARVLALTVPDLMRIRLCFLTGFLLDTFPGWAKVMTLPADEKLAALADPEVRRRLLDGVNSPEAGPFARIAQWHRMTVEEAFTDETKRHEGRLVGDIAEEQGKEPFDALLDIVVEDGLRTVILPPQSGDDEDSWALRAQTWRDPRVILGASDAGAHLDFIATFNYTTAFLGDSVRDRGLMGLEEAVHKLTDVPARLYGLTGRGRLAEGWIADVVVFDPDRIAPGPVGMRADLPAGAARLYSEPEGVEHVLVNGVEIVGPGATFTDARPGTLLRSGRDTETVSLHTGSSSLGAPSASGSSS